MHYNRCSFLPMITLLVKDVSSILKVSEIYQGKGILLVTGCGNQGIDTINEMSLILKAIHGL